MIVNWRALICREIPFLQQDNVLYIFDLRGPNVTPWLEIPDFWKYENVLPWILQGKRVAVNEDATQLKYTRTNELVVGPRSADPRVSLIERLSEDAFEGMKTIWAGVPHPDIDNVSRLHELPCSFTFSDFLEYNDKFSQKQRLEDLTPAWRIANSQNDIEPLRGTTSPWLLKRRRGSGGWQVHSLAQISDQKLQRAFARSHDWFVEQRVSGKVMSIQCFSLEKPSSVTVFGVVEQLIDSGTHFVGGRILPLSNFDSSVKAQLEAAINKLAPLLQKYEGFWGIDFILTEARQIFVLEANVRMTAMTIPVLVANEHEAVGEFCEDVPPSDTQPSGITITEDLIRGTVDILRLGKTF